MQYAKIIEIGASLLTLFKL